MMNSIARTLQKTILILSATTLSLLSLPSFAQMSIEITGVGQSLYPIAVMRFKDENKLPTSITDIIRQDLARSGYLKIQRTAMLVKVMKAHQTLSLGLPVVLMP